MGNRDLALGSLIDLEGKGRTPLALLYRSGIKNSLRNRGGHVELVGSSSGHAWHPSKGLQPR